MASLPKKYYALVIEFFDLAIQYLLRAYQGCLVFVGRPCFRAVGYECGDVLTDLPMALIISDKWTGMSPMGSMEK